MSASYCYYLQVDYYYPFQKHPFVFVMGKIIILAMSFKDFFFLDTVSQQVT